MVALYGAEFSHTEKLAGRDATPAWLMTHRPFRAIASYISNSDQEKITTTDQTLQDAPAASEHGRLPEQIALTLAGNVHHFEYLEFLPQSNGSRSHPRLIVFGAGGTKLDPGLAGGMHGLTLAKLQDLSADTQTFVTQNTFD